MSGNAATGEAGLWARIGTQADMPELLSAITQVVAAELVGFQAAVFVVDGSGTRLALATPEQLSSALVSRLASRPLASSGEPSVAAVVLRQPAFVSNLQTRRQPSGARVAPQLVGVRSAWAVPLMNGAACVGSLAVFGVRPGLPDARQRRLLEKYSTLAALVMRAHKSRAFRSVAEAELRCIYDNVNDVLFSVDVHGDDEFLVQSANRRFLEATGLAREQVVGQPVRRVIPEPSLSFALQHYRQALRERRTVTWEETTTYPAGVKIGEVRISPVFDPDGTCTRLVGSVHDITEQKRLQENLVRASRLYGALSQCNQAIVQCDSELLLFEKVCRAAVEFGGMQFAWIGMHDPSTDLLKPVACQGIGSEYVDAIEVSVDATKPTGVGPGGAAFRSRHPVWCQDFQADPCLAAWHVRGARAGWKAVAVLPLTCGDRVAGVFVLYSKAKQAFDSEAQRLLTEMALDISFGLAKLQAQRERHKERVELEKLSRVVDQSDNMVVIVDADTRITYVNPAFEKVTGYSSGDVVGMRTKALLSHRTPATLYSAMNSQLKRGVSWRGEVAGIKKDGTEINCLAHVSPLFSESGVVSSYVGVAQDVTEQRKSEQLIEHLKNFDELTGLPNRVYLKREFDRVTSASTARDANVALLVLDVDRFKLVNDAEDQTRGDRLLQNLAIRLQDAVGERGVTCRLSGDEFAIMLIDADAPRAADIAQRMLGVATTPYDVADSSIVLTTSIGVAIYARDGTGFETLFRNANLAMYRAKLDGRNCWRPYVEAMHTRTKRTAEIVAKLGRAIVNDAFELHYQPQIAGDRIVGVEALVRWRDSALGVVPPSEFIPIAEECGLIVALDDLVLRNAVRQAKVWLDAGIDVVVGVNISPVHFRVAHLYDCVVRALGEVGLPPRQLELEITEGAAMHDPNGAIALLGKLHALGIHIAIDDFGIGYSSLSYLKQFTIDRLKIDKSFVDDLTVDEDDRAIVRTIISMANYLKLETVAEGVETREQFEFLAAQGCEVVQGYLFSKALNAPDFVEFWHTWQAPVGRSA